MFYIRDCNNRIVGNPRGYRTIRGALAQQNRVGSPAFNAIWDAYYARENEYALCGVALENRANGVCDIREGTE